MEITLTVNGKMVKATVDDNEMREAMREKNTGYGIEGNYCFYVDLKNEVSGCNDGSDITKVIEESCNCYSRHEVAENNARADALMRKLRRFAAEHGGCLKFKEDGYEIYWDRTYNRIKTINVSGPFKYIVGVIFASENAAQKAIDAYYNDLLWYFTEYDPMPKGWWEK